MSRVTIFLTCLFTLTAPLTPYFISFALAEHAIGGANSGCPCFNSGFILSLCKTVNKGQLIFDSKVYGPSPGVRSSDGGAGDVTLTCMGKMQDSRSEWMEGLGEYKFGQSRWDGFYNGAGGNCHGPMYGQVHAKLHQFKTTRAEELRCVEELLWVKEKLYLRVIDKN